MDVQLHKGQMEIFQDPHRFRVAVMGRRYGKSRLLTWELILRALSFPRKTDPVSPERVLGVLPTLVQAKKILWQPLVNICETQLSSVVSKIDRTEYRIDFKGHKPSIIVAGANDNNGDRLRGLRVYFAGCDEVQDFKPDILETVILPAMSDTVGSRALFTGTPKGKLNHLFKLFNQETILPTEYKSFNHPTWLNPTIDPLEVEAARIRLPPRLFAQEYEASFVDFPGKYYTELDEFNIYQETPKSFDVTVMGVDWGDVNPAFVVLGRRLNGNWYLLEHWQPSGEQPVPQPMQDSELVRLASKWNVKATFADPSRPSAILGLRSLGEEYNLEGLRKATGAYNRIEEGINQVHSLIYQKKLFFPSDRVAYDLMSAYHRKIDKNGIIQDEPAPGQNDHICDSIRYSLSTKKGTL